jgi:hypothetical protein
MPALCSFFCSGSRALIVLLSAVALFFATYAVGLNDPTLQLVAAGYAFAAGAGAWWQVRIRHERDRQDVRETA